ncbi:ATP-binding protein [Floccifex sp.]|uniref:ATP-binding protein n=1 Tax=Floccifex sp. TaxID=2815810 RepID=UPI003F01A878
MLERKVYDLLLKWKKNHKNKCLMIKGARQVGKTFIVREFGKNEYESFIEINFIQHKELKDIFDSDLSADTIYKRMSAFIQNIKFIPGNTLIFLDEIQNCGNARTAIKFLAEDGKYDIITSGSLLGLTYAENGDKDVEEPISVPTGYEDFITMYSLDFEEFLWAEGYSKESIDVLKEYFDHKTKVPTILNEKYENLFREFMVVGGMPEVVSDYVLHHDFNRVMELQERILENYKFDIAKHAKGAEKVKVRNCYEAIPKQLAKELKKFQYSTVEKGKTSKKYGGSIQWLKDSNLVHPCYNIHEPFIPLMANAIEEQFKLYINDTGLLSSMYGFETKRAILTNTIKGNAKGGIYENIISECLIKKGYKIYYYKPDDNHELEFLLEQEGEVIPVEVKAGNTATVTLNRFIEEYHPSKAYKFITGNIGVVDSKISLPHYMVLFI